MLVADLVGLERGEAREAHVEDRLRLQLGELEALDQAGFGRLGVARAADQLDHRVEVVERDQQPLEDVGAGLGLAQLVLGAADDDLALVRDVVLDQLLEAQGARHAVDQGDHVDPEGALHRRALVELVEDHLGRVAAALGLDHQAHAGAVGLVAQVGDPGDLFLADEVGDLRDQAAVAALLDHEWQLGDDDRVAAALERLDVGAGADPNRGSARGVGVADSFGAHDPAAGEVRALDVLHQAGEVDAGIGDVGLDRADRLAAGCAAGCWSPSRPRSRRSR